MAERNDEERTIPATEYRRRKAEDEGRIPRSEEVMSSLAIIGAGIVVWSLSDVVGREPGYILQSLLDHASSANGGSVADAAGVLRDSTFRFVRTTGSALLIFVGIALLTGIGQAKGRLSVKGLEFKWERLNPAEFVRNQMGLQAVVNLVKQVLKLVLVGGVAWLVLRKDWPLMLDAHLLSPVAAASLLAQMVGYLLLLTGAAYLIIAGVDYGYAVFKYEEDLKMTVQEFKEEIKSVLGDKDIRRYRWERFQEIARGGMVAAVRDADVVITNPTHYAVAVTYNQELGGPVIVAKGTDDLATLIRETAERHQVPVVRYPILARTLERNVDVGQLIPQTLWHAMVVVYRALVTGNGTLPSHLTNS